MIAWHGTRIRRWRTPYVEVAMKYGLLWLLGVPIPVLIIIYLMFHH